MLERLKALDDLAHARGFRCAFREGHLLLAFPWMRWRCPLWRVLQPVQNWLPRYRKWLAELIELPARIAATLHLRTPQATAARAARPVPAGAIQLADAHHEVFSAGLWRLLGEGGMALIMIASGTIFGGVALLFGLEGLERGFESIGGNYTLLMVLVGLAYGVYAISFGLWQLARLAWRWGAPLRGIPAAQSTGRASDRISTRPS